MRTKFHDQVEKRRVMLGEFGTRRGELFGMFNVPLKTPNGGHVTAKVMVGTGLGFDHVSVSLNGRERCPTWQEMCIVKELFFEDDEPVMQLHPPKFDNVSVHKYCLHLWRPLDNSIPRPPMEMV